jgi:nanoRNase/pAp phosphatase (c-di-AMP/oligoRNAs hydrolase)
MVINEAMDKATEFQKENALVLMIDHLSDNKCLMMFEDVKVGLTACNKILSLVWRDLNDKDFQ